MKLFRVTKHKRYVDRYLFTLKLDIVNITLTASRKGGLNDEALSRISNSASLIKKYQRRAKLLEY